jgi:hypothetical protein
LAANQNCVNNLEANRRPASGGGDGFEKKIVDGATAGENMTLSLTDPAMG